MSFGDFGLPDRLVSVLHRRGMSAPFPIQAATLPDSLAGRDVLGRGRTGSGKTLAFGLPTLVRLAAGPDAAPTRPRGLVLVPTRELALQVRDALEPLGRALGVRLAAVVGGAPFVKQVGQLRRGAELVVATPGRLTDLISQHACDLSDVAVTVLDEADQMCDMGFLPAVTELLDQVRPDGQRMLFSATLDGEVDSLVARYLTDPVTHSTDPGTASVSTMDHHLVQVFPPDKQAVTAQIANRAGRTLLFVRTRSFADRLEEQLRSVGVAARALHGGKTQAVRTRTLAEFREGRVTALVATDVAARGIHVDDVTLVLQVDPAGDAKDYLHRAGRTARAGETGTVVTLVTPRQRRFAESIAQQAGVSARRLRLRRLDEAAQRIDPLLVEVTGAREPSGEPVPEAPAPRRVRPRRDDRIPYQRGPHHRDDRRPDRYRQRDAVRHGEQHRDDDRRTDRGYAARDDRRTDSGYAARGDRGRDTRDERRPAREYDGRRGGFRGDDPGYDGRRGGRGGFRGVDRGAGGDRDRRGGYRGEDRADRGLGGRRDGRDERRGDDGYDRRAADRGAGSDRDRAGDRDAARDRREDRGYRGRPGRGDRHGGADGTGRYEHGRGRTGHADDRRGGTHPSRADRGPRWPAHRD